MFKAFTGGTLIDGTVAKPVEDASIIVEGDKIKADGDIKVRGDKTKIHLLLKGGVVEVNRGI